MGSEWAVGAPGVLFSPSNVQNTHCAPLPHLVVYVSCLITHIVQGRYILDRNIITFLFTFLVLQFRVFFFSLFFMYKFLDGERRLED